MMIPGKPDRPVPGSTNSHVPSHGDEHIFLARKLASRNVRIIKWARFYSDGVRQTAPFISGGAGDATGGAAQAPRWQRCGAVLAGSF